MADKIPQQVLFNDGEALRSEDLNNLQRMIQAYVADGILSTLGYSLDEPAIPAGLEQTSAVGNGGAVFVDEAANLTVDFAPGMIGQHSGAAVTGNTPAMLWYYMESADVPDKTRPVATTNPRWDILTVQLTEGDEASESRDFKDATTGALSTQSLNKRRNVNATFTWTQGVEAASPVEPAVPAGHVKLCAVEVPTSAVIFNPFAGGSSDLRDYRVPVGFTVIKQDALEAEERYKTISGSPTFSVFPNSGRPSNRRVSAGSADEVRGYWQCPLASPLHRVKRFVIESQGGGSGLDQDLVIGDSSNDFWPDLGGFNNVVGFQEPYPADAVDFNTLTPVWCNGHAAGYAASVHSDYINDVPNSGPRNLSVRHTIDPVAAGPFAYDIRRAYWEIWGI